MADKVIKWHLKAPLDCHGVLMPDGYSDVIIANDANSDFSIEIYIDDSQMGSFGPATEENYGLIAGKEIIKVKTGPKVSGNAYGSFTFRK